MGGRLAGWATERPSGARERDPGAANSFRAARWLGLVLTLGLGSNAGALLGQEVVHAGRGVSRDAVIRIVLLTGSLRVNAWSRDSVWVEGRVDAGIGRFFLAGAASALKLGVEPAQDYQPGGTADLDVRVPAGARLRVTSAATDIDITAGGGSVEVTTGSGRVRIAGSVEAVSAETLDGNVELALNGGTGRVRTASGTIVVRGVIRDLEASTVSGPVEVGMERPIARARMETVSGEIAFKGSLDRDGRLEAQTHGGDVELRLPARLAAAFHLVSYGGGLVNKLVAPATLHRGPGKGEWSFTTGDGQATVEIRTFKGTITLKPKGE
jgi:hypothetical protein